MAGLEPGPAGGQPPLALAFVPNAPAYEVLDRLPNGTPQDRLRQLRQHSADLHALIPRFETIREASTAKQEAASAHRRLVSHQQEGGFNLKPDHPSVVQALKTLERAEGELARLQARQAERSAAWNAAGGVLAACETWLRDRPGGTLLEAVEIEPPKLLKGEKGLLDAIENRRRRGRELKATLHTIRSAPMPSSWAKQAMREQVEALAMQGTPSTALLIEHGGKIEFQTQRLQSEVFGSTERSLAFAQVPDTLALTCWLMKDALIKRLDGEIAAEADDAAALGHEERQRRTSEVEADLLAVERDEAALVWHAMGDKLPVEHRADCSPLAILQVQLVTVPRADVSGTSPMHAYDIVLGGRR
jgi:hypothetical protein